MLYWVDVKKYSLFGVISCFSTLLTCSLIRPCLGLRDLKGVSFFFLNSNIRFCPNICFYYVAILSVEVS